MSSLPNCPKCNSEYTYEDGVLFVCPECSYEWAHEEEQIEEEKLKQAKLDSEVSMAKYKKDLEIEQIKFNHILLEWKRVKCFRPISSCRK